MLNAVTSQWSFRQPSQRPQTSSFTRPSNQLCRNCGLTWSANHKDNCIARGKTCNNCGLQNHFHECAESRSPHQISLPARILALLKTPQLIRRWTQSKIWTITPNAKSDYDSSDDNMVASIASNTIQIEPKNTTLQIGNTQVGLLIDSGRVCSNLTESHYSTRDSKSST